MKFQELWQQKPAGDAASATAQGQFEPRELAVQCLSPHGLHHMAYVEWGDPGNPHVVVCVHGLTRNGRDFDFLAQALAADYRVVCPDVVGRGRSDWLPVSQAYGFPQYLADMVTLLARLNARTVDWVGTSMGGIIGMLLASQAHSPLQRLVLNDVGPQIGAAALRRIGEYVGRAPEFQTVAQAEAWLREVSADFGPLSDAQWRHLTEYSVKPKGEGFVMRYDPAIGDAFRSTPVTEDVNLWPVYDAIRCPTLVIRGAESDLLEPATVAEMTRRGPQARAVEIPLVGHAPMLMDEAQISIVRDFFKPQEGAAGR